MVPGWSSTSTSLATSWNSFTSGSLAAPADAGEPVDSGDGAESGQQPGEDQRREDQPNLRALGCPYRFGRNMLRQLSNYLWYYRSRWRDLRQHRGDRIAAEEATRVVDRLEVENPAIFCRAKGFFCTVRIAQIEEVDVGSRQRYTAAGPPRSRRSTRASAASCAGSTQPVSIMRLNSCSRLPKAMASSGTRLTAPP